MNDKCVGCFKPVKNPTVCISCNYMDAHNVVKAAEVIGGFTLSSDEAEEIKYEIYCRMKGLDREVIKLMESSGLANIISKCSDTAIYLAKKRFVDLDDMKVVLFDLQYNEAYITNGDVVIRISDMPDGILDGLRNDLPAYDYISERFIPNPLAYTTEDLAKALLQEDYVAKVITIPVNYILEKMYRSCPQALQRRSSIAVIDVGYGFWEGSLVIPRFDISRNGMRFWQLPDGKVILVDKHSKIPNDMIEPEISYVGFPTSMEVGQIFVNVYKKFEETTTIGIYNVVPTFSDDIHPYDLELYAEKNLIKFKLVSAIDKFNDQESKMREYMNFAPVVVEAEYLYETLLLYSSFGFEFVNILIRSPELPIKLEGIRNIEGQPMIEAAMAIVAIGRDGRECEQMLEAAHVK